VSYEQLTADDVRAAVALALDESPETIDEDQNLIERGLDSIRLMRLAGRWRQAGIEASFAELAERPTLGDWCHLLAERSQQAAAAATSRPAPAGAADPEPELCEPFALAVMQHAYWVGRSDDQQLGAVAAHLYTEFDGTDVDPARLARAVELVVARHEMLRARFLDDGTQHIAAVAERPALPVLDLSDASDEEVRERTEALRDELSHQLLDVAHGEVLDVRLTLLPGGRTRVHVDVDMLAADALSYRILMADLARCYEQPDAPQEPIGTSFRAYLAERDDVRGASGERARAWWRERLPELPGAPQLPLVAESERADARAVVRRHHWLSPEQRERWSARANEHGVTPAMALATVFAETLGAWSAQPRFLLNVPLFDREPLHEDVARLVGDFTSSVLVEIDLAQPLAFGERARRVQARTHADAAHAAYSGVEVLRDLSRAHGEQVLAPVVFTSALNLGELFDAAVERCFGRPEWIVSQGPQVLLDAQVTELHGGLLVNWDVRRDAFCDGVVDAMFAAFCDLLERLGGSDEGWRAPVDALLPASQLAVRARVNATDGPAPARALHDVFFERADREPQLPAVVWDGGELSYGELADRALRVAAALAERGVEPGEPVGVRLPKGPEQVVAVLGVLAAGGVYVPIGIDQPAARRRRIEHIAGVRVTIVAEPGEGAATLALSSAFAHQRPRELPAAIDPAAPAYVLFTSGSTGEPKGVELPHAAAVNTIDDLNERFGVGPGDRCLAISALEFDLSVYDIFGLLSAGGAVVCVDESERRDARAWARIVREHDVTVVNCVPALLDMLLAAAGDDELGEGLRVVLLGGDWVATELRTRLAAAVPGCRFVGLGGTTETAIHSTVCEIDDVPEGWLNVPYGTPLHNVRCRVVDVQGRDCPDWVAGELWMGGAGVALGYRGDPERTADRFVEHDGLRWYRTGDMARYRPDGTVEFLGRRDDQVKIRGLRIELGEVEAALQAHPDVERAVAVVLRDGAPRLAAGVVTSDPSIVDALRDATPELLPAHMVPERIVALDAVPLTANGKVDRGAVIARVSDEIAPAVLQPPRNALEQAVALVWGAVLGSERVGIGDDFFALGGDSVLATAIAARLRDALETDAISVRDVFSSLTAGAMAERIAAAGDAEQLEQIAAVYVEIEAMADDEVAARLEAVADDHAVAR
jgi:mycobactin phenyloxazoline synthetase